LFALQLSGERKREGGKESFVLVGCCCCWVWRDGSREVEKKYESSASAVLCIGVVLFGEREEKD